MADEQRSEPDPPHSAQPLEGELREIDSRDLLQGSRLIRIRHGEEIYYLAHTRSGKLILRK